jgi:hypothetical protein
MVQAEVAGSYEAVEAQGDPLWWILLVTGSLWIVFALIVFQFDYTTVSALSILVGTVCIAGALFQAIAAFASHGWWRVANIVLALAFGAIGVAAYAHPENTFNALASIFLGDRRLAPGAPGRAVVGRARLGHGAGPARLLGGRRLRAQGVPARRLGGSLCACARRRPDRDRSPPAPARRRSYLSLISDARSAASCRDETPSLR